MHMHMCMHMSRVHAHASTHFRHAVAKEAALEVMRRLPNKTHAKERADELRRLLASGASTAAAISDAGFSDGGELLDLRSLAPHATAHPTPARAAHPRLPPVPCAQVRPRTAPSRRPSAPTRRGARSQP
jgi:hypothetical protein